MQVADTEDECEFRDDAIGRDAVTNVSAPWHTALKPTGPDPSVFSIPPLDIPLQGTGSIAEIALQFRFAEVALCCIGSAALLESSGLIEKLRGALGVSLHETASPAVKARGNCTWRPPCGWQVLWMPQGEVRPGYAVPAPLVLLAEVRGDDLFLTARLFGFACDYLGEVGDALIRALKRGLTGIAPGGLEVSDRQFRASDGLDIPAIHAQAALRFHTPLLIRGPNAEGSVEPAAFLRGLIHRVDGMARWHGLRLEKELALALLEAAASVESHWEEAKQLSWRRRAVQQGRDVPMKGALGTLYLRGNLAPFAALIGIGALTFAGSRTAFGQGRYSIGHML